MNIKPNFCKILRLAGVSIAFTTLCACVDTMEANLHPGVNTEGNDSIEVPLDFDWNMSQDVDIQLISNVTTRAYIYEDENLEKLMCTTMLEADKLETVSLTTLKTFENLYLAYLDKDGKTVVRTIDIGKKQVLTRAANATITVSTSGAIVSTGNTSVRGTLIRLQPSTVCSGIVRN